MVYISLIYGRYVFIILSAKDDLDGWGSWAWPEVVCWSHTEMIDIKIQITDTDPLQPLFSDTLNTHHWVGLNQGHVFQDVLGWLLLQ